MEMGDRKKRVESSQWIDFLGELRWDGKIMRDIGVRLERENSTVRSFLVHEYQCLRLHESESESISIRGWR